MSGKKDATTKHRNVAMWNLTSLVSGDSCGHLGELPYPIRACYYQSRGLRMKKDYAKDYDVQHGAAW